MLTHQSLTPVRHMLWRRIFVLALLVSALPASAGAPANPATDFSVYLPMITINLGIHGTVTESGVAVAGIEVRLVHMQDGYGEYIASATTDAKGRYSFPAAPTLNPGRSYKVEYINNVFNYDWSRLGSWATREITDYTAGTSIHIGDFDVSNVELLLPSFGSAITLPYTFTWIKRPASPTDNYHVYIFNPGNYPPYYPYYLTPPLGWIGEVQISSLPPEFVAGHPYRWKVRIIGADGSLGTSNVSPIFCFTTCPTGGSDVASRLATATLLNYRVNGIPESQQH